MALEYAKCYPSSVSHVVMIGMAPYYDDKAKDWAEKSWQLIASDERKAALKRNLDAYPDELINRLPELKRFVKDYLRNGPKIWFDYDFDAESLWDNVELNLQGFNYIWGELFPKFDFTNNLENFNISVAVMIGKYDSIGGPPESWDAVKDKFKKLCVYVFDKSGHTPPLEEPEMFNRKLANFLETY